MADLDGDDRIEIVRVIGGGEQPWAAVNTRCVGPNKDGKLLASNLGLLSRNLWASRENSV